MKKSLLLLLLALVATLSRAAAVEPSVLNADGSFAADTKWYVLTITNAQLLLHNHGTTPHMPLDQPVRATEIGDEHLWCFVGNAADGYLLYNKAAGTSRVLTAPKNRSANTGGDAHAALRAQGLAHHDERWDIVAYTKGGANFADPQCLRVHGDAAANLNNRGGKLAFWTTNTDAGSAVNLLTPEAARALKNTGKQQYLFPSLPGRPPYRIPAIAQARNGNLIAITDHRPSGADIGVGEVDIKARISKDNGRTWGPEFYIANGTGVPKTATCGFGDAAVVADRESNEVLLICVSGNTTYWDGNYPAGNPNPVALIRSHDGGETWDSYLDITEQIYAPFKQSRHGAIKSLFFGSGRLCQSQRIKVGSHFRVYGAVAARDGGNRVFYSDDFGTTWHVLGGIDALPSPTGDEPKIEELPNGNVVLSSRVAFKPHRVFNIYTYSDPRSGAGTWSTAVNSGNVAGGVRALDNNTNGELIIVPALRKSDGARCFVALQSVPFGSGRNNVGIYYKALADADLQSVTAFAGNWEGRKQVSTLPSAYSTMILQQDGRIGFFFEESTFGADYTEVYEPLSLEEITDGKYAIDAAYDPLADAVAGYESRLAALRSTPTGGEVRLGHARPEGLPAVDAALAAFKASPADPDLRRALDEAFLQATVQPADSTLYRLVNLDTATEMRPAQGTQHIVAAPGGSGAEASGEWLALYVEKRKAWRLYNPATQSYVRSTSNEGSSVVRSNTVVGSALYAIESTPEGVSTLRFVDSAKAPYLSFKAGRLVGTADATKPAARWHVVYLRKLPTAIALPAADAAPEAPRYDLSGRRVDAGSKGVQILRSGRKVVVR